MTGSIGDFTPEGLEAPVEGVPDTFTFCGELFEIPSTVGSGSLLRFVAGLKSATDTGRRGQDALRRAVTEEGRGRARMQIAQADQDGMVAVHMLLRACLGEGQVDRFYDLADRYQIGMYALLDVCNRIQEAIADRPTRRSTDSSTGPSTSGPNSTGDGSGGTETPAVLTPREQQVAAFEAASTPIGGTPV